jgi:hypothetical protein
VRRSSWTKPEYSRGRVDRAGEAVVRSVDGWLDFPDPVVIANWRAAHSFPLNTFQVTLRKRAQRSDIAPLVVQRLKRYASIEKKLRLQPKMKLSRMQDLGGCRAVMTNMIGVTKVLAAYDSDYRRGRGHEFIKPSDYVREPKGDGYRSIHLVYRYRPRSVTQEPWQGLRIEIQLRTERQHLWASAVEIVETFTGTRIRGGTGREGWGRFFALASAATAMAEASAPVPDTPRRPKALREELLGVMSELGVESQLREWGEHISVLPVTGGFRKVVAYALSLDQASRTTRVVGFDSWNRANEEYHLLEKARPDLQTVLVAGEPIRAIRRAYPSYYLSTKRFVSTLTRTLEWLERREVRRAVERQKREAGG